MKRKLKGLLMAVCMVLSMLAVPVGAFAAEDEAVVSDSDRASLESYAQQTIMSITSMTDEQMDEILKPSSVLVVSNTFQTSALQSWKDAREVLGEFEATNSHDIQVTDDEIVVTTKASFEKGEGTVTTTISREDMAPTGIVFDSNTDTTLGSKMEKAALNTLMGIAVVFLMLIFLSFLISLFKHFGKLEGSGRKGEPENKALTAQVPVIAEPEEELVDDGELVAVIAAAIAASENTSTDGFVVRSIKRSNKRKWQNA